MIKDFVTIDRQKNVRHRAIIGTIDDFKQVGYIPEDSKKIGYAVKDDFSGRVKFPFASETNAENWLRRVYA